MPLMQLNSFRSTRRLTTLAILIVFCTLTIACKSEVEPEPLALEIVQPVEPQTEPEDPLKEARADAQIKAQALIMPITEQAQVVAAEIEASQNQPVVQARRPRIQEAETGQIVDQRQVRAVLSQNQGAMKNCYERALRRDPNLRGRVVLNLLIGTSGAVNEAKVRGETLNDTMVSECMEQLARALVFPKPEGGAVRMNVPYMFSPQF